MLWFLWRWLPGVPQEIVERAQDVCIALKEGKGIDRVESEGIHEKDNKFKVGGN